MLSLEQRNYVELYNKVGGMRNVAYISGLAQKITARGGFIQQTPNLNQMIPFELEGKASMPANIRDGSVIKIVARVGGRLVKPKEGADPKAPLQREMVLRVLKFETPSVLEMPPEAAWAMSVPKGAPVGEDRPEDGKHGQPFTRGSNLVEVAGFVSGVFLRKAGVPGPDGKRPSGCLHLLIQQTKNPDDAIPVRVYGKLSEAIEGKIKLGSPVYIQSGEARIDVKETGVMLEGGLAEVTKVMYVKSQGLAVATRELINDQPEWAIELARAGLALKGKGPKPAGVGTARPALQVATPEEEPAAVETATATAAAGGSALDGDDEAALAAATAELGGAKR